MSTTDRSPGQRRKHLQRIAEGVYQVHPRACPAPHEACTCRPQDRRYQAVVHVAADNRLVRKHFPSLRAAKDWRGEAGAAARKGTLRAPTTTTLGDAAGDLIAGMRTGAIRTRSGDPYKPSATRSYERALRLRVLPGLGASRRVSAVTRGEVQALVETMAAEGLSASTIANTLDPLRVIYRRAAHAGGVAVDPTVGLELPANRGHRDRIAGIQEADLLLAALPVEDRPLWATALFAGLRRGELRALRCTDIELTAGTDGAMHGVVRVRRALDDDRGVGEIATKSIAGERTVPLLDPLPELLNEHLLATGRTGTDLVFGASATVAFTASTVRRRALAAWKAQNAREEEEAMGEGRDPELLEPIGLHEARHCAASYFIAAGWNIKMVSERIGHTDVRTTLNRYGKLLPGTEQEDAERANRVLAGMRAKVAPG